MKSKSLYQIGIICAFLISLFVISSPFDTHAASDMKIEINKHTNYLYLYSNGDVIKTYRVATGKTSTPTPVGTFVIGVKINQPGWKNIPGGHPNNPLGPRWNGLVINQDSARKYGIHGTNKPSSIGDHVSDGCIRMHNEQVIELYNHIYEGVPVWIHTGTSKKVWKGDHTVGLRSLSGRVKVTASTLNVRTGPTTGAFTIGQVKRNNILTLVGYTKYWYKVKLANGKLGFVSKQYVVRY